MSSHLLAIEIGGTKLQLCAGTGDGAIVERVRHRIEPGAGAAGIRARIEAELPGLMERWGPVAIGVGFGGPVRWRTGQIARSHHVDGWEDFPLGEWLRGCVGVPVFVENDGNVAALGEARHGAGAGCDPVFYITLGSGVGGGLVVDGRIYHGAAPGEAEIGHVRLDRAGRIVEEECSGWAMDRRVGDARRLASGAVEMERALDEHAAALGFALSHVVHLLNPEIIVVGGGLSLLGEPLRARIAAELPRHVMEAFQPGPRVVLAGLGEDAVPVGALALAAAAR